MQAARILVDGQSDLVLDYGIPPEAGDVKPGCRVQVPLRNRTATGTVLTLSEPAPAWKDRLKPILKLIDPEPLISPVMMNLASWAADYYSVALDQMIRCLLPETVRQENTAEKMRKMVYLEKTPAREELDALYRKSTPAGPNAGLFLIRETTVRPPGGIRRRSPERCPQPGSQRLHLP